MKTLVTAIKVSPLLPLWQYKWKTKNGRST